MRNLRLLPAVVFWAMVVGCAAKRQEPPLPLVPPRITVSTDHFAGTPLSGPRAGDFSKVSSDQALALRVQVTALGRMPQGAEPLGTAARIIFANQGDVPVLPSVRLTSSARLSRGAQLEIASQGNTAPISDIQAALPVGATAVFQVDDSSPLTAATSRDTRKVILQVARPAAGLTPATASDRVLLAVVVDDLAPLPAARENRELQGMAEEGKDKTKASRQPLQQVFQREVAVTDEFDLSANGHFAIAIPFQFTGGTASAVLFNIEVAGGTNTPEHQQALAKCVEDISRSNDALKRALAAQPRDESALAGTRAAIAALKSQTGSRRALLYVSDQTGAALCGDAALGGDDALIASLSNAITSDQSIPGAPDLVTLGWLLDRATLTLLTGMLNDNKLPAEMGSVLTRHTGEAGRHAGSLEELLRTSGNRNDFNSRLIAENYIYLEDNAPSARVRALQWLAAQDQAPAGFDPLGPVRQRRAAIERALAAPATQPTAVKP